MFSRFIYEKQQQLNEKESGGAGSIDEPLLVDEPTVRFLPLKSNIRRQQKYNRYEISELLCLLSLIMLKKPVYDLAGT